MVYFDIRLLPPQATSQFGGLDDKMNKISEGDARYEPNIG